MNVLPTRIKGLVLIEPQVFPDDRGIFFEGFHQEKYREIGIAESFVQDNISWSKANVLRGLHFQNPNPQAKLVQVLTGEVFDVAVDLRRGSPTFGEWEGYSLSDENHWQFFIPAGFAHGFAVTRGPALLSYKCSGFYDPKGDATLRFDDPAVDVQWPFRDNIILSPKDRSGTLLADMPVEKLFP